MATNDSYVSSEQTHSIVRYNSPNTALSVTSASTGVYASQFDRVWTQEPLRLVTGFDLADDATYAVSPNSRRVVQYNRTTGKRMASFDDEDLERPIDVIVLGSQIHVCATDEVRVYNRASSEFLYRHVYKPNMVCASMLRGYSAGWVVPPSPPPPPPPP